jgi:hypothetical protein
MSQILNWPNGVVFKDFGGSPSGWFSADPVFLWEVQDTPIIYCDSEGIIHKPVQNIGITDFGTIPWVLQVVPSLHPLRFKIPCMFHDDCFQTHEFCISEDNGVTWKNILVNQRQANDRLHDMILVNPSRVGTASEANMYWVGVQGGGWMYWGSRAETVRKLKII